MGQPLRMIQRRLRREVTSITSGAREAPKGQSCALNARTGWCLSSTHQLEHAAMIGGTVGPVVRQCCILCRGRRRRLLPTIANARCVARSVFAATACPLLLRKRPMRQARGYRPTARRPVLDELLLHRQPRYSDPRPGCVRYRCEDGYSGHTRHHWERCLLLFPRGWCVGGRGKAFWARCGQKISVR
jgi:hypothetical protein